MQSSVPKLISDLNVPAPTDELDVDVPLNKEPATSGALSLLMPGLGHIYSGQESKAFFYLAASIISGTLLFFLLIVNFISPEFLLKIFKGLSILPFFDIVPTKGTFELLEDLKFPNAFTIFILFTCVTYTVLVARDAIKSTKPQLFLPEYKRESVSESSSISFAIHALVILIILILGFAFFKPRKPEIQVTQIEFIPTQVVSKKPPPKNTKRRADKQSIDQGKTNPKQPVKAITPPPGPPAKPKAPTPKAAPKPSPKSAAPAPKSRPEPSPPKPEFRPISQTVPTPKPVPVARGSKQAAPKAYIPAPSIYKAEEGGRTDYASPAPKSNIGSSSSASGERSSGLVARLSNLPRVPTISGSPGSGGAYGSRGNPGDNPYPNAPPSVAARADLDFGPYMSALQRRIKLAWKPPRGTESSRIVVNFVVNRDGSLGEITMRISSGLPAADEAARDAVRRSAPFQPLPVGAPGSVEVEFTFDYNVFQKSRF